MVNIPAPVPGEGEILVRVTAAGVTPTELLWYPTTHDKAGGPREQAVQGHEFSGVVAALGEGATGFAVGQPIFGMNDWFADGATAEYCVTRPEWITAKAELLSDAEAAVVPISALTAYQGLFLKMKLRKGERLLVNGGGGSIGRLVIQMAHHAGVEVVTTASNADTEALQTLGACEVIDYHRAVPPNDSFDGIFDTVGGETLSRSWTMLRPAGRLVTIAADVERLTDERAKAAFFIVEPSAAQLATIASWFELGLLKVGAEPLKFEEAASAYLHLSTRPRGRGKACVQI